MGARVTPARYDLYLTVMQKIALTLPLVVVAFVAVVFFGIHANAADQGVDVQTPIVLPLMMLVFVIAFFFATVARAPYRITVTHSQQLEFKSLLSVRTVRIADLVSIEPKSLYSNIGISGYVLKYRDGKIMYPGQITGMYILLHELKQANPALEIRGC